MVADSRLVLSLHCSSDWSTWSKTVLRSNGAEVLRAQFHHVYRFALDVSRVTSRDRLKCFDALTRNSIHVVRSRVQGKVIMVKMATA